MIETLRERSNWTEVKLWFCEGEAVKEIESFEIEIESESESETEWLSLWKEKKIKDILIYILNIF